MKERPKYKVVFIGAGNVATHLSQALKQSGCTILQVYSRTEASASILAQKLQVPYSTDLSEINVNADLYIFSVKDDAIVDCIKKLPPLNGMFVHTAGSVPLSIFEGFTQRFGVIYPLQTFSKERNISFSNVPFFIEASNKQDEQMLYDIVHLISGNISVLSSDKRKYLHLSAVFACNFTNHLYDLAAQILEEQNLPFDLLLPLIDETTAKVHRMIPHKAQTGPAVRYDEQVIQNHINLLSNDNNKKIYDIISKNINVVFNR